MNESSDALFTAESVSNWNLLLIIIGQYWWNNNWMNVVKFPNLINISLLLQINNYPLKLSLPKNLNNPKIWVKIVNPNQILVLTFYPVQELHFTLIPSHCRLWWFVILFIRLQSGLKVMCVICAELSSQHFKDR